MSEEYRPFTLERAFDAYEFKAGVRQMSCSDGEPMAQADLLALADAECRQLWDGLTLAYTQLGGHPLLLEALTGSGGCYSDRCAGQIVPAVPQEGILLAMMALCDQIRAEWGQPDFEAVVAWPSYQSLHETLRSRGVVLKLWTLKAASDTEWTFDLEELRSLIGDRTRLLVVNFPHNPSGYSPTPENWRAVIELCRRHRVYLFSDEIYNACVYNSSDSASGPKIPLVAVEPAANLYERAVSMSGLSKCHGLPGLRLGWLVSQNADLLRRIRLLKDYTTICLPAPVEILGLVALRNSTHLTGRICDIVAGNLQLARAFFASRHGRLFGWREPVAGTTALVELRDPILGKFNGGRRFCETMIDRFNVFVVCSDEFQFSDRYFRLGLGRRDLGDAFAQLEAALGELDLV